MLNEGGVRLLADGKLQFRIFCPGEVQLELLLFVPGEQHPAHVESLDSAAQDSEGWWSCEVSGWSLPVEYLWRVTRAGVNSIALDPYAKVVTGAPDWNQAGTHLPDYWTEERIRPRRCWFGKPVLDSYDDLYPNSRPKRPIDQQIVYELHVRGFTQDPSSGVGSPGTYRGLVEKIPYLKSLGVTAVQWMPCHEFEETLNPRKNPATGEQLVNYWGYDPVHFMAPKQAYAEASSAEGLIEEIRSTIHAFHNAGIEVWLDVVFNHTAEFDIDGPAFMFKTLAPRVYYQHREAKFYDCTGCGNAINGDHPVSQGLILSSLKWWHLGLGIDGFRFDLAAALTRSGNGKPLRTPTLMKAIADDEGLKTAHLIAEAWDAKGLYRLGEFPHWGRWVEWNGKFRDSVRRFWRGDHGVRSELATRMMGSADLYSNAPLGAGHSVNYLASHDGMTLLDAFFYREKQNWENGEENRDGDDHEVLELTKGLEEANTLDSWYVRWRGLWASLLFSRGVPMFFMGDERGRTQRGNNNSWCQDNSIGWMDWSLLPVQPTDADGSVHAQPFDVQEGLEWIRSLIGMRRAHPGFQGRQVIPANPQLFDPEWGPSDRVDAIWLDETIPLELKISASDESWVMLKMHPGAKGPIAEVLSKIKKADPEGSA